MNLDDLFEMQPSDVPTYLRRKMGQPDLTMRDIEKQTPKSVYRYRVGDEEFMDYQAALDYAQGTRQQVQTIKEESGDSEARRRGTANIGMMWKTKATTQPVIIDVGTAKYRIAAPKDKEWFLRKFEGYRRTNQADRFLEIMGSQRGFEQLLDQFADAHSDMSGGQQGSNKSPRYQKESADQKKRIEKLDEEDPRVQRAISQLRARYPQASSDIEAMLYTLKDVESQNQQDRDDIQRLERSADDLEQDIKSEIGKRIRALGTGRGRAGLALGQVQATTDKQQDIINKIIQIDQDQQRALDDLESTVKQQVRSPGLAVTTPKSSSTDDATAPASLPPSAFGNMAKQLTTPVKTAPVPPEPIRDIGSTLPPAPQSDLIPDEPEQELPAGVSDLGKKRRQRQAKLSFGQDQKDTDTIRKVGEQNIGIRGLVEKKKPMPTNPDLWSRAKSAARSKFDVYPSAYANAWAAKWYKSKGGGWRMGKGAKK